MATRKNKSAGKIRGKNKAAPKKRGKPKVAEPVCTLDSVMLTGQVSCCYDECCCEI